MERRGKTGSEAPWPIWSSGGFCVRNTASPTLAAGRGRFAVAFARRVHWVTGFDLSPRMIHYGMEHARREGVENVTLRACDFQTLDVRQEGLESAFDLVFSSLTPAIHGRAGLEKVMAMEPGLLLQHHPHCPRKLPAAADPGTAVRPAGNIPLGAGAGFIPCSTYCFYWATSRRPATTTGCRSGASGRRPATRP